VAQGVRVSRIENASILKRAVSDDATFAFVLFRHPSEDDPVLMYHVVSQTLARTGKRVTPAGHPVFLYGRDVPIWGGPIVAWALPRAGAISVFHDVVNRASLDEVYETIRTRSNPVVLAPEGQVTYHNYLVSPIQRGSAALAVDALEYRPASSTVAIIPAAIEYRYPDRRRKIASRIFRRVYTRLDLGTPPTREELSRDMRAPLIRAWTACLDQLLAIHRTEVPRLVAAIAPDGIPAADALQERSDLLVEVSLRRAESVLGLTGNASPLARIFRIRQRYWERIFPADRGSRGTMRRAVADVSASEARLVARHMQCADVLVYVSFAYLDPLEPTPAPDAGSALHARAIEYLLMLDDLIQRTIGGTIGDRFSWPRRTCIVRFGDAIEVGPRTEEISRRARIRSLLERIDNALISLSDAPPRGPETI
jgi:1-acyl-sn-glycerol-3-phosphate acyltransferase